MACADQITVQPSSSPQLPSPSTFIRPPAGAHAGFASASSLWKRQQHDGGDGAAVAAGSMPAGTDSAEKAAPAAKGSSGKLKRPTKVAAPPLGPSVPAAVEGMGRRPGRKTEQHQPRKRKPKSEAIIINSDEPEQSAYFAAPRSAHEPTTAEPLPLPVLDGAETAALAPRRRSSWTPVKNTVACALPQGLPPTADGALCVPSPAPRVPLSELLGNFNYTNNDSTTSPPPERATTGEATTKRRRIELTDTSTVSVIARKSTSKGSTAAEMPLPKPAKRSKSPRKKPQTITALATAAYQPLKEPEPEQSTVSEFFVPRKEDAHASRAIAEKPTAETVKAKKPRKPRTKKVAEDGTFTAALAKKPGRPKKAKVKFDEAKLLPPLYSPVRANSQLQQQALLFGTSSQLATDDSPTFIREIQMAIHESEFVPASQAMTSPAKKSCAKVPTAPHGTCLSVEQAQKELWCSGARDFKGGLLREKSGLSGRDVRKRPEVAISELQSTSIPPAHAMITGSSDMIRSPSRMPDMNEALTAAPGHDSFLDIGRVCSQTKKADTPIEANEPDSFIDIDDIIDHDSPPTPSPPRRRASAPPSPVQQLSFEATGPSPERRQTSTALPATNAALKSTDAQWSTISKQLFTRITAAVKGSPHVTDPTKPNWHQKILLYDPIVLEDLTAYLNTHDLRVNVQRTKRKAPTKSRKKKDAPVETGSEVETVEEELQAWMVQKWCEEMSVCCLWKGGLRGGVRAQY